MRAGCRVAAYCGLFVLPLAACAGGGGGGNSPSSSPLSSPASQPAPPPPNLTGQPNSAGAEYQRNWGLDAIHASAAFSAGATGQGITVAVIDSGVNPDQADLAGAVSADSTDIIAGRNTPVGTTRHGTEVAGIIASRHNGMGTIGVAYQSTILSVRADSNSGGYADSNTAAAIDYAVAHGARVINLSIGGDSADSAQLSQALQRAAAAGVVIVASAGNDTGANPNWPARNSTAGLEGMIIAAGATDRSGAIASFSNRAGDRASRFLAAPGDGVTAHCDSIQCWDLTGTSFSAPHIAGALALLLQAFPNLTGRQAVDILFTSAFDAGAPGVDSTYGRGVLDLARAFKPLGATSIQGQGGETYVVSQAPGTEVGAAFGDATARTPQGLVTVAYDSYQRRFTVDLSGVLAGARAGGLTDVAAASRSDVTNASGPGVSLSLVSETPLIATSEGPDTPLWMRRDEPASARVDATLGRLSLNAWRGQGGTPAPAYGGRSAFRETAAPDRVMRAAYQFGPWSLAAEGGWSRRAEPGRVASEDASAYGAASAGFQGGGWRGQVLVGQLSERLGPLGSALPTSGDFALPASTRFATVSAERSLAGGVLIYGDASAGVTEAQGRVVSLENAWSSSWRLGVSSPCPAYCSNLAVELSQPLRMEGGAFTAVLPDAGGGYFDDLTWSQRRVTATPSGRQLDLGIFASRDLDRFGQLRLSARARFEGGHVAGAAPDFGLTAGWRARF